MILERANSNPFLAIFPVRNYKSKIGNPASFRRSRQLANRRAIATLFETLNLCVLRASVVNPLLRVPSPLRVRLFAIDLPEELSEKW